MSNCTLSSRKYVGCRPMLWLSSCLGTTTYRWYFVSFIILWNEVGDISKPFHLDDRFPNSSKEVLIIAIFSRDVTVRSLPLRALFMLWLVPSWKNFTQVFFYCLLRGGCTPVNWTCHRLIISFMLFVLAKSTQTQTRFSIVNQGILTVSDKRFLHTVCLCVIPVLCPS